MKCQIDSPRKSRTGHRPRRYLFQRWRGMYLTGSIRFPTNGVQLRSIRMRLGSSSQTHAEIDLTGQIFNVDVGLNDRPGDSQGQYGLPIASKGRWSSANTFSLDLDTIAN